MRVNDGEIDCMNGDDYAVHFRFWQILQIHRLDHFGVLEDVNNYLIDLIKTENG